MKLNTSTRRRFVNATRSVLLRRIIQALIHSMRSLTETDASATALMVLPMVTARKQVSASKDANQNCELGLINAGGEEACEYS